jgi:hypothetical protein
MTKEQIKLMNDTISALVCYKNGEWSRIGLMNYLKNFLELPEDVVEHVNTIIDR